MAADHESTITRGFLFADLRGYTGDSTQQFVSLFRVDPEADGGAGDWVLVKQQDYGPPQ